MSLQALVDALNAHARVDPVLEPGDLLRMVKASGLDLHYQERKPPVVAPGQVEAFDLGDIHCARCGRHLKHPEYLNGAPFGSTCVIKEGIGE